jgi:hypothetical protein
MRPLHPTCGCHPPLGCHTGSPFRCSPARCVASDARSCPDALVLARPPDVRPPVLARPGGTRLPDARPPNTRSVPASHLQEAGDGSEARHGTTTSVAEHDTRRNRRRAVGGRRAASHKDRVGNSSMGTRYPSGTSTEMFFYPRVAPESRRVQGGYFFHPRVTRRVPDILLPL